MTARKLGVSALTMLDVPPPDATVAVTEASFDAIELRILPAGDGPT